MTILWTKTGSDGNCSVIETSDGSLFMIDCGIRLDIVNQQIGYRLNEINYCLVTHNHQDHVGYIQKVLGRGIEVYCPLSSIPDIPQSKFCVKNINPKSTIKLGGVGITVKPFPLIHTNSNGEKCEIYGFLIKENATGKTLLWATDTQYIPQKFPPCDIYALECNYSEVDNYCEDGEYMNAIVEKRRLVSHQSLQSLVEFLKKQDLSKCREIHLIHISGAEKNNIPKFISTIQNNVKEGIKKHGA
jgi:phosphoribosyl 1,2-cyclic phosphodiesterase